jgi:hypothetical protein
MPSHIWRFPEIGVPPKIIYFNWDFPLWTIQLWGYPYLHMEANFKRIDNRALISGSSSMRSIEIPYFVHAWINWNHNSLDQIVHQEISSFVAVIPARSRSRTVISSLFRNYPTFCCHKSQHVTTVWKKSPLIRQTMANSQATSMAVSENQVAPIHPTPMVFLLRINRHFRTKPGWIMNYSHSLSWRKTVIIETAICKWFPSNFPWF